MRRRGGTGAATTYLVVGAFASVLAFPFYWMFITAFKTGHDLYDPANVPVIFNESPTLEHVRQLLRDTPYPHWVENTMFVGLSVVAVTLAVSLPAAYALARYSEPCVRRVGAAIFLSSLVPPTLLFLPLSRLVSDVRLHDSLWSLVLVYPSFTVPGSTWLLTGFFKTIPADIEEAALVDGCSQLRALRSVILPVSAPAIVCVAIFSFTLATNEFVYGVTFITSAAQKTISTGLPSHLVRGDVLSWGPLMAGVLMPSLVMGLLYTGLVTWLMSWWVGARS